MEQNKQKVTKNVNLYINDRKSNPFTHFFVVQAISIQWHYTTISYPLGDSQNYQPRGADSFDTRPERYDIVVLLYSCFITQVLYFSRNCFLLITVINKYW